MDVSWEEIGKLTLLLSLALGSVYVFCRLVGQDFWEALKRGPSREPRSVAGWVSLSGVVSFMVFAVHGETLAFVDGFLTTSHETTTVLEHGSNSALALTFTFFAVIGNFVLLALFAERK